MTTIRRRMLGRSRCRSRRLGRRPEIAKRLALVAELGKDGSECQIEGKGSSKTENRTASHRVTQKQGENDDHDHRIDEPFSEQTSPWNMSRGIPSHEGESFTRIGFTRRHVAGDAVTGNIDAGWACQSGCDARTSTGPWCLGCRHAYRDAHWRRRLSWPECSDSCDRSQGRGGIR